MGFVLRVRSGNTYRAQLTATDHSGDPIDLTGYTFEWHIAVGDSIHTYTTTPNVVLTGNVLTLYLSPTDSAFTTGRGRHWLVAFTPGGDKFTWFDDNVEVEFDE